MAEFDHTACYCKVGVYSKKLYHRETDCKGIECMLLVKKRDLKNTEQFDAWWNTNHYYCDSCGGCNMKQQTEEL